MLLLRGLVGLVWYVVLGPQIPIPGSPGEANFDVKYGSKQRNRLKRFAS